MNSVELCLDPTHVVPALLYLVLSAAGDPCPGVDHQRALSSYSGISILIFTNDYLYANILEQIFHDICNTV
uniref:Secreted protein n=1 Tax=Heterorhabditis bacteriophora TaxID=37862 RepID=A0A1I7X9U1_HETBA